MSAAESREAYAQRALAARVTQGLPEHIEDPATLDFIANIFLSVRATDHRNNIAARSRSTTNKELP